jgi:hypothetical protein
MAVDHCGEFMGFLSKKIPKYEEERIALEAG